MPQQYSDIPQGFEVKGFSDVPEGFSVPQAAQRKFVGPMPYQANSAARNVATGLADVALEGARSLVNKPAASLVGLAGGINPNDTYSAAQQRELSRQGRGPLGSPGLRTHQGAGISAVMGATPSTFQGQMLGVGIQAGGDLIEKTLGPEARDFIGSAATLAMLRTPRSVPKNTGVARAALTPEEIVARSRAGGSAGASAAATNIAGIGDDLRQAIARTGSRGVNQEALSRHVQADTLPVPIRLTRAEALQDPVAISLERNLRGKHPEMALRMDETNRALGQNLSAIRDKVGPDVFSTNAVEHGDTLIGAYRRLDAMAEAEVNQLYSQLRNSFGDRVPVDAAAILKNATNELHNRLLYDHAPPAEMAQLTRLAEAKNMTFENFEAMRTNLARIMRSSTDGNMRAAAGVIREAMEDLPFIPGSGAERMKPIADAARAAARRRFQAIESDPAYEAAINGVPPDRFVQRFVIGGTRDDVDRMVKSIGADPAARQTISVAVLDHLRDAARLDPGYAGNFSSAGFSRALQSLDPKANIVFDPRTAETLGNLRSVANYTTYQPRGSFVNNSNTLVGSAAKYGADAIEGATNFAFMGVPVGTMTRRGIEAIGTRRTIRNALQPGAGVAAPKNSLAR